MGRTCRTAGGRGCTAERGKDDSRAAQEDQAGGRRTARQPSARYSLPAKSGEHREGIDHRHEDGAARPLARRHFKAGRGRTSFLGWHLPSAGRHRAAARLGACAHVPAHARTALRTHRHRPMTGTKNCMLHAQAPTPRARSSAISKSRRDSPCAAPSSRAARPDHELLSRGPPLHTSGTWLHRQSTQEERLVLRRWARASGTDCCCKGGRRRSSTGTSHITPSSTQQSAATAKVIKVSPNVQAMRICGGGRLREGRFKAQAGEAGPWRPTVRESHRRTRRAAYMSHLLHAHLLLASLLGHHV